jgi:hypothetical protein
MAILQQQVRIVKPAGEAASWETEKGWISRSFIKKGRPHTKWLMVSMAPMLVAARMVSRAA